MAGSHGRANKRRKGANGKRTREAPAEQEQSIAGHDQQLQPELVSTFSIGDQTPVPAAVVQVCGHHQQLSAMGLPTCVTCLCPLLGMNHGCCRSLAATWDARTLPQRAWHANAGLYTSLKVRAATAGSTIDGTRAAERITLQGTLHQHRLQTGACLLCAFPLIATTSVTSLVSMPALAKVQAMAKLFPLANRVTLLIGSRFSTETLATIRPSMERFLRLEHLTLCNITPCESVITGTVSEAETNKPLPLCLLRHGNF